MDEYRGVQPDEATRADVHDDGADDQVETTGIAAELQRMAIGEPRPDDELTLDEYLRRHCRHLSRYFEPDDPDEIANVLLAKASETKVTVDELRARIARMERAMRSYHQFLRANAELINQPKYERTTRAFYRLAARCGAFEPDADLARLKAAYHDDRLQHGASATQAPTSLLDKPFVTEGPIDSLPQQQRAASYVLQTAARSPRPSAWPWLEWQQVMTQAIERIRNPFSTDIQGPYFCGPTFTLSVLIEKEPMRYARLVIEIMSHGTFDGRDVSPQLRAAAPVHNDGELSVDWMVMSSLRNTHPNMFGRYFGDDTEDYAPDDKGSLVARLGKLDREEFSEQRAGTSVGRMTSDIKDVLGYEVIESSYYWQEDLIKDVAPNRFIKGGLQKIIELLPETYDPSTPYIAAMLVSLGKSGRGNAMEWNDKKSWSSKIGANIDAIHWLRIVSRPKHNGEAYELELFEHGERRVATYAAADLDADVYGYVIARRPSGP